MQQQIVSQARTESRIRFRWPLSAWSQCSYQIRHISHSFVVRIWCQWMWNYDGALCALLPPLCNSKFRSLLPPLHRAAVNLIDSCTHTLRCMGMKGRLRKLCLSQRWCSAIWLLFLVQWYFSPEEKLCAVEHLFSVAQTQSKGEEEG